ncbi:MAG: reprolysin-like metallopeptidase, partial [Planctomycetota bacterium]
HVHEEDNGGFVFSTKSAATSAMQDFTEGCDIGQPIDVYIAYTTNSRVAAGGTAAILAEIDLAIAQTNQAYANSGITTPLRLVGTEEVNYNELTGSFAALEDNLDRLRDPGDGFLDSLHASRDATGADLLALLLDGSFGSTLGLAQIRGAFSVNRWDRIADFVLAHELGHNRGSEHETRSSPITFPYARAHQFNASGARRTIMYSILSFATIPYFSNPNVNFMGVPTGIANSRDNARSHNELESEIASFRCSSTLCSTLYSFGELEFSSGTAFGLPDGTDIVWMKRFDVQANATNINQISVGVGILSTEPQDIWLAIFDDPNNDGNPSDATLIASFGPVSAETLKNVTLSIPPISVGSPGDRFFVGASLSQRSGDFPIGFTPGADGGRSFFFFGATENTVPGGTLLSITSNTAITALGNNNVNADLAQPFGQLDAADTVEFLSLLSANSTDAERAAPSSVRDAFDLFVHMNAAENLCP